MIAENGTKNKKMKDKFKILAEVTNNGLDFSVSAAYEAMEKYAAQFRTIRTTTGEEIIYDEEDYWILRNNNLFLDSNRNIVMTTYNASVSNHTGIPIAKIILGLKGKSIIRYKDKNPLNLKKENLETISFQKAHFKNKIPKNNTSGYKGVSWNKNAKAYGVSIKVEGRKKHLGYVRDVHEAALLYNEAAKKYYGEEYAFLNDVPRTKVK